MSVATADAPTCGLCQAATYIVPDVDSLWAREPGPTAPILQRTWGFGRNPGGPLSSAEAHEAPRARGGMEGGSVAAPGAASPAPSELIRLLSFHGITLLSFRLTFSRREQRCFPKAWTAFYPPWQTWFKGKAALHFGSCGPLPLLLNPSLRGGPLSQGVPSPRGSHGAPPRWDPWAAGPLLSRRCLGCG